jgi:nucleotide-binding universal stress UspA family protein
MQTVLCPTRGGDASYPDQDRAIALAKERGARLVFLYVTDVRFLFKGSAALVVDMEHELDEMGEFLLTMAQERAEKQGVTAEAIVRHGSFRQAVSEVAESYQVSLIVFGAPGEDRLTNVSYLRELADELRREHNVEVLLVRQGIEVGPEDDD